MKRALFTVEFIRTKPPMAQLRKEWMEIGYNKLRIGSRIYEVWGWGRDAKNCIQNNTIILYEEGHRPIATNYPVKVYESLTRYIECTYFE